MPKYLHHKYTLLIEWLDTYRQVPANKIKLLKVESCIIYIGVGESNIVQQLLGLITVYPEELYSLIQGYIHQ